MKVHFFKYSAFCRNLLFQYNHLKQFITFGNNIYIAQGRRSSSIDSREGSCCFQPSLSCLPTTYVTSLTFPLPHLLTLQSSLMFASKLKFPFTFPSKYVFPLANPVSHSRLLLSPLYF